MLDSITTLFSNVLGKGIGWTDEVFDRTKPYDKYLIYALLLAVASKMFKFKIKIG